MRAPASTMKPRQMLTASDGAEVTGSIAPRNLRTSTLYLDDASGAVEPLNGKGLSYDLPLLLGTKRPPRTQPQRYSPLPLLVLPEDIL